MSELERELYKALKGLMARVEDGSLVRNIEDDASSTWVLKAMSLVQNLKAAQDALDKAEKIK